MDKVFGLIVVGIICIVLGIMNMKGNLSLLHSYHKKRVSEEDKIPFGRAIGLGTLVCGGGLLLNGIFYLIHLVSSMQIFLYIAMALLILGLVVGIVLIIYALLKYNRGIFQICNNNYKNHKRTTTQSAIQSSIYSAIQSAIQSVRGILVRTKFYALLFCFTRFTKSS